MDYTKDDSTSASSSTGKISNLRQKYQQLLDRICPYVTIRWIFAIVCVVLYAIRASVIGGWYIVSYAFAIYLLSLLLAFLTPKIDPAFDEDEDEDGDGPQLPTTVNQEFRPFIRRLPEFKFWHRVMIAVTIAYLATCFNIFDIPVFWPVLVVYFVILFFLTMKKQISHMIKYKYLPFSYGKRRYRGKEDTGKVITN